MSGYLPFDAATDPQRRKVYDAAVDWLEGPDSHDPALCEPKLAEAIVDAVGLDPH